MVQDVIASIVEQDYSIPIYRDKIDNITAVIHHGIITLEDILEEIVGEISDEADKHKDSYILPLGENTWFAKNVVDLNSFCRITGAKPELHDKHPYDTLQGLIMFHLKRLPKVGDRIEVDNFSFEVKNMVEDQIILIQIKKTTSSNEKE